MIRTRNKNAFTLIEIMIALLLVSSLGLLLTNYLRNSSRNMASADRSGELRDQTLITNKLVSDDLIQAVYLNPSCADNPARATATLDCDEVIIKGGITPFPGYSQEDMDLLVDFQVPSNLEDDPGLLTDDNDAIRVVLFHENIDCPLDTTTANNPSDSSEKLWVDSAACANEIKPGQLYMILETVDSVVYSNVFQVTAVDDETTPNEIDISSSTSIFNPTGGLGIAGYSNRARLYSVKLVELAVSSVDEGLFRREVVPTASDLTGFTAWVQIQPLVENLQFFPLTLTTAGAVTHTRTMQFDSDENNDGLEDIRGVSPRVVLKSSRSDPSGTLFDNPITSVSEDDPFPRAELNFYVSMFNFR